MANRESLYSLADKDDAVVLEGTLGYSQLREKHPARSSLIDADVYTIELVDPKLADTKKWGLKDNGADTKLGQNILRDSSEMAHGTYVSKSGANKGKRVWSFDSKSKFPITILDLKTKDTAPANELLDKELAPGQPVLVRFSLYEYNFHGNTGLSGSLDFVAIEDAEDIKYYNGGSTNFSSMFDSGKTGSIAKETKSAPASDTSEKSNDADEADDTDLDNLFDE